MTVERTIKVIAPDGETVACELSMQDGGAAAEVRCPVEWQTAATLLEIASACTKMAGLINAGGE